MVFFIFIQATGGASVKLALDAVGGDVARDMMRCLSAGGVFVAYGTLSGEPISIQPASLIYKVFFAPLLCYLVRFFLYFHFQLIFFEVEDQNLRIPHLCWRTTKQTTEQAGKRAS